MDFDQIDKSFYYFIRTNIKKNRIFKVGKEHPNPFLSINEDNINIGIFGDINVEKIDLAFRIIYDELYEHFYDDFKTNFADIDLIKLIQINGKPQKLAIIDSTLAKNIDTSYYSLVQGIIFVFSIDIISSPNYIESIRNHYDKAKKSIKNEIIFAIGLKVNKNKPDIKIQQQEHSKIENIQEQFKCPVFIFSIETGENVEDMFFYLTKKIIKNYKQNNKTKLKSHIRKHKKKQTHK